MKNVLTRAIAAAALVTFLGAPVAQAQYPPRCGPGLVRVQIGGPGTNTQMILCAVVLATAPDACPLGLQRVLIPTTGPTAGQVVCATILANPSQPFASATLPKPAPVTSDSFSALEQLALLSVSGAGLGAIAWTLFRRVRTA